MKSNLKTISITLIGVLLLAGWFYWFQYRQSRIRHNCSWVRHYEEAMAERPAMSEEELSTKGMIGNCGDMVIATKFKILTGLNEFNEKRVEFCEDENRRIIEEYKNPKPAEPEKEWYTEASAEEYKFCLHDHGL